jgi:hypothetical protein
LATKFWFFTGIFEFFFWNVLGRSFRFHFALYASFFHGKMNLTHQINRRLINFDGSKARNQYVRREATTLPSLLGSTSFWRVILDTFLNLKKICNSRFHGPRTFVEFSQLTVSFPGKAELFHDMHMLRNKPMNFDRSNTRSCLKI